MDAVTTEGELGCIKTLSGGGRLTSMVNCSRASILPSARILILKHCLLLASGLNVTENGPTV